jgi:hypothetical protein
VPLNTPFAVPVRLPMAGKEYEGGHEARLASWISASQGSAAS